MLYLANPCTPGVRDAMATTGHLAAIMSPRQGNQLPADALFADRQQLRPRQGRSARQGLPR